MAIAQDDEENASAKMISNAFGSNAAYSAASVLFQWRLVDHDFSS